MSPASHGGWTTAWVALGSNLGPSRATLDAAVAALRAAPGVRDVRASSWIETDAVGGPAGQPRFWNGALGLETTLGARALLGLLQEIEARHGRERSREVPDGPRTLDLDLLLFGDERHDTAELRVPHPRLEEREFVLVPLRELAPDLVLAGCGRSVRERCRELAAAREGSCVP